MRKPNCSRTNMMCIRREELNYINDTTLELNSINFLKMIQITPFLANEIWIARKRPSKGMQLFGIGYIEATG